MSSIKRFTRERFGKYAILRNLLCRGIGLRAAVGAIVAMLRLSRLVKSRRRAFNSPYMDINKITEKGNALAIVTVCNALSPLRSAGQ